MFSRPRKSRSLQLLHSLKNRMKLTREQQRIYQRMQRGYTGEVHFAALFQKEFHNPCIPIYSLNVKVANSECQIDCLLIFQHEILPLEIKYFPGDYRYQDQRFFIAATDREINNPILQINRTRAILHDFLSFHRSPLKISPYTLFVHPEFHLYDAPQHESLIYPGQVKRFIRNLHSVPHHLQAHHQFIAEKFKQAHLTQSSHEIMPTYDYQQVKKGIVCVHCDGVLERDQVKKNLICNVCYQREKTEMAVIRNCKEFELLFPDLEITVSSVYEWCNGIVSKEYLKKVLSRNLQLIHKGRYSHYRFTD